MDTTPTIVSQPYDSIAAFRRKQMLRLYIYGGGIVLLAVIFGASLYFLNQEVLTAQKARGMRASLNATLNAYADLIKGKGVAETAMVRLSHDLPSPLDVPTVLLPHIKTLARARNLRVDLSLGASAPNTQSSVVNLSIRADGTMQNILDFLNDLENDSTVMSITGWGISPSGGEYQLNAGASLYVQVRQ